jgi:serine/threonine protein kinase
MERYRKLKVIGKGSFGYAVLVQSVADRQSYVMKASILLRRLNVCLDH